MKYLPTSPFRRVLLRRVSLSPRIQSRAENWTELEGGEFDQVPVFSLVNMLDLFAAFCAVFETADVPSLRDFKRLLGEEMRGENSVVRKIA